MKKKLFLIIIVVGIGYFIGPMIIQGIYRMNTSNEEELELRNEYNHITINEMSNETRKEYLYYWFRVRGWEIDQGDEEVYTSDLWLDIFTFWRLKE